MSAIDLVLMKWGAMDPIATGNSYVFVFVFTVYIV